MPKQGVMLTAVSHYTTVFFKTTTKNTWGQNTPFPAWTCKLSVPADWVCYSFHFEEKKMGVFQLAQNISLFCPSQIRNQKLRLSASAVLTTLQVLLMWFLPLRSEYWFHTADNCALLCLLSFAFLLFLTWEIADSLCYNILPLTFRQAKLFVPSDTW